MTALTSPSVAPKRLALRVERVVSAGQFTAIHAGDQVIVLRMQPSARAARTASACVSQLAAVRVTIRDGQIWAALTGVDHRLPVERACSVPAALAMAAAGVTTFVSTDGSVGEGEVAPR